MTRAVVAILALAIVAMLAVVGVQAALENAGDDRLVVNETWTPDAGNVTQLDESGRTGAYYSTNVTVYDENETEMDRGTDYEWFVANGTVKALVGGGLDGDTEATITYAFQQTTAEQRQMAAVLGELPRVLGLALPALVFVLFLILARGGG